jgi:hypothetical protein
MSFWREHNELDNALGRLVARGGLGAEHEGAGQKVHVGVVVEHGLQMGYQHGAHKLALIFVQPLYLYVHDGAGVEDEAVVELHGEGGKVLLIQRFISPRRRVRRRQMQNPAAL